MTVLISFAGTQDPYTGPSGTKPGPILSLLDQRSFDIIYLLSTPGTNAETRAVKSAIGKRHVESRVVLVSTGLEDVTDFMAVHAALSAKIEFIISKHRGASCWGFVTPGTPQMQAGWMWLAERMELRLLELHLPRHVSAERPLLREISVRTPFRTDHNPHDRELFARAMRASPMAPDFVRGMHDLAEHDLSEHDLSEHDEPALSRSIPPSVLPPTEGMIAEFDLAHPPSPDDGDRSFLRRSDGTRLPAYLEVAKEIGIAGDEPCMREMLYTAYRCALRAIPVLITGETGTGKDLLARYIHRLSPRSEQPCITMNCAAITDTLAESELFGVKKGAYTGADTDREGKFTAADGGTLFLDEIGDLSPEIQAKILRALENAEIQRVGDAKTRKVDVRFVAATNRDLHAAVKDKFFRDDLLSRLSVGTIHVPPLRERRGDIPVIAQHLLDLANRNEGVEKHFTPEALQLLTSSSWDRWNIRELRTAIERAWTMAEGNTIDYHHFKILEPGTSSETGFPLPELHSSFSWQTFLEELRDRVFTKALAMGGGNASAAARLLGVTPQAVSQFQLKQKTGPSAIK